MSAQPDESPARQGLRRLQLLAELESRGAVLIPLADLERLRAIRQRARDVVENEYLFYDTPGAEDVARYILGEDG